MREIYGARLNGCTTKQRYLWRAVIIQEALEIDSGKK
jgi:hypothetical protein